MTLDITKPTDQELVSELPAYIRANRSAINAFESGNAEYATTILTIAAATDTLIVGTDLANVDMEVIIISAAGACTLEKITGGTAGQIKIFVFQDDDITLQDGTKADGKFYLNQLPVGTTYAASQDDVIALVNIGGTGAISGYWKEFNRQLDVK
uniref:Uncharacterized protein n=1 Tax=viral metagenome TaxID=1070528 RepID=A0A6H1ZVZ9_9ZZZZ